MSDIHKYLYFPRCKITRCDSLGENNLNHFTLFIKSLEKTPKHYPEHYMLEGKADFFFKLNTFYSNNKQFNKLVWDTKYKDRFKSIFGNTPDLIKPKECLKKEICVLAVFNPESEITLQTIGIGLINEEPTLFNTSESFETLDAYARVAKLNYKLDKIVKKPTKIIKI